MISRKFYEMILRNEMGVGNVTTIVKIHPLGLRRVVVVKWPEISFNLLPILRSEVKEKNVDHHV